MCLLMLPPQHQKIFIDYRKVPPPTKFPWPRYATSDFFCNTGSSLQFSPLSNTFTIQELTLDLTYPSMQIKPPYNFPCHPGYTHIYSTLLGFTSLDKTMVFLQIVVYNIQQTSGVRLFVDHFKYWYMTRIFNRYIFLAVFRPIPRLWKTMNWFTTCCILKVCYDILNLQNTFIVRLFADTGIFQ